MEPNVMREETPKPYFFAIIVKTMMQNTSFKTELLHMPLKLCILPKLLQIIGK